MGLIGRSGGLGMGGTCCTVCVCVCGGGDLTENPQKDLKKKKEKCLAAVQRHCLFHLVC